MSTEIKPKSLYEVAIAKGIKTQQELYQFIGNRKVKVIKSDRSVSGHNYPPVFVVDKNKIGSLLNTSAYTHQTVLSNCEKGSIASRSGIYLEELTFYQPTKQDLVDDLNKLTEEFKAAEAELKNKLELLEEVGLDEYDEKLVRIMQVLGNFEVKKGSKINKLEQAKLLAGALE